MYTQFAWLLIQNYPTEISDGLLKKHDEVG
jgi:hypothetical protein